MRVVKLSLLAMILVAELAIAQKRYEPNWASIDSRPIPSWFEDAKFGIFIHWGLYSVPAWAPTDASIYEKYAEWYWWRLTDAKSSTHQHFRDFHTKMYGEGAKYQDFVKGFTCEMFDPKEWARIFSDAGARYVVLTSKHHEGFTLWPSAQSWNWNAVDVGPHRDLAGDLMKAVKDGGLKMGYYYSLYEWFNPLYRADVKRYVDEHMLPQMRDLVTRYQPDIIWTDGEWDHSSEVWRSTEFLAWLYNESPVRDHVVVNDRWGKETRSKHGGIYTTEYDLVHDENSQGKKIEHPWEECRGIGGSFGYNRNEDLSDYSSSAELIYILIDKVARGGNLLLNIGPTADGRIPVIMQQRLTDIGAWLKVNGEAIYGTRAWEKAPVIKAGTKQFYTRKGKDLYVICTGYPEGGVVVNNTKAPSSVTMLGFKGSVRHNFAAGKLTITPPALNPGNNPCDHAWVFKLSNAF
jgi:alpha-L-fucosidase